MRPRRAHALAQRLARAELRGRPRRHTRLFIALAGGTACLFLVLALLQGVTGSVGRELQETLVSDVRLTDGSEDFGRGRPFTGVEDALESLRWMHRGTGAAFAPRFEVNVLVERGGDLENWNAALLVGIRGSEDRAATGLDSRVTEGRFLPDNPVVQDHVTYHPVLVSRSFRESVGIDLWDGAGPIGHEHVLNATAGREVSSGAAIRVRLVAVGEYATGFKLVDDRTLFSTLSAPRVLTGGGATEDVATVIVGRVDEPAAVLGWAQERGFNATDGRAFTEDLLAPLFATLRIVTYASSLVLVAALVAWVAHASGGLVHEDRRHVAALRALGVPNRVVALAYVYAAGIVGLAGGLAGLATGGLLGGLLDVSPWSPAVLDELRVSLRLDAALGAGLVLLSVVVNATAVAAATRAATRGTIAEDLRGA